MLRLSPIALMFACVGGVGSLGVLKAAKAAKASARSAALLPQLAAARIAVSRVVGVAAGLGAVQLQCDGLLLT